MTDIIIYWDSTEMWLIANKLDLKFFSTTNYWDHIGMGALN